MYRWMPVVLVVAMSVAVAATGEKDMTEERTFTVTEAHRWFAIELNNSTWALIEKSDRMPEETARMVHQAHASAYHWIEAGTPINHARAEYLVSRAHAAADHPAAALRHALRCNELVEANSDEAADWDVAFAYEAVARGYAIGGDTVQAREWLANAEAAIKAIEDPEDREICETELNREPWNGVR